MPISGQLHHLLPSMGLQKRGFGQLIKMFSQMPVFCLPKQRTLKIKKTFVTPEGIIPVPKLKATAKGISRKRGKTAILTSSPYKNELEESEQIKKQKLKGKDLVKKTF